MGEQLLQPLETGATGFHLHTRVKPERMPLKATFTGKASGCTERTGRHISLCTKRASIHRPCCTCMYMHGQAGLVSSCRAIAKNRVLTAVGWCWPTNSHAICSASRQDRSGQWCGINTSTSPTQYKQTAPKHHTKFLYNRKHTQVFMFFCFLDILIILDIRQWSFLVHKETTEPWIMSGPTLFVLTSFLPEQHSASVSSVTSLHGRGRRPQRTLGSSIPDAAPGLCDTLHNLSWGGMCTQCPNKTESTRYPSYLQMWQHALNSCPLSICRGPKLYSCCSGCPENRGPRLYLFFQGSQDKPWLSNKQTLGIHACSLCRNRRC